MRNGRLASSNDARQHGETLPLIPVAKLATVPLLLLPGPNGHLTDGDHGEQARTPAFVGHPNAKPGQGFEKVVGTCDGHTGKDTRSWYTSFSGALFPEITQSEMGGKVAKLANDE